MRGRGLFVMVLGVAACLVESTTDTGEAWQETDAASSSSSSSSSGDAGSSTSSTSTSSSSSGGESSGSSSTGAPTTSPPDDDGGGTPSLGPACSVQEVTRGAKYNPLPRGGGSFPFEVADAFEDYCGCHTLADNEANVEWEFLRPPEATLFLTHGDLSRSYEGGTLGQSMATALRGGMPPGSCPHPDEPLALLAEWFAQGMPAQE